MRARGLSLWLVPPAAEAKRLAGVIGDLARRLGSPPFRPHVTLVPGLRHAPASLGAGLLALGPLPAPEVRLFRVGDSVSYFQCLFLEAAPDLPLVELRRCVLAALGSRAAAFFPHLSLAYAALPSGARRALATELAPLAPLRFKAVALEIWKTEGEVGEWSRLAVLPLSGCGVPPARPAPP
jgi:hypothetical protein